MTRRQVTVQIADDSTSVLCTKGRGPKTKVAWAGVLTDTRPDEVARFIAARTADLGWRKVELLLLVSDRRVVAGTVERAVAPPRADLPALLRDRSIQQGLFTDAERLAIGFTESRGGGGWTASFVAAPEAVFSAYVEAIEASGFTSVRVISVESVLAQGIATGDEVVGIVDTRGSSAYFLLACGGQMLAVRKILIPALDDLGSAEASGMDPYLLLGADLVRSVDYFSGQGLGRPSRVVFTVDSIASITDQSLAFLGEMLEVGCERIEPGYQEMIPQPARAAGLSWHSHLFAAIGLDAKTTPYLREIVPQRLTHGGTRSILPVTGIAALAAGVCLIVLANGDDLVKRRQVFEAQIELVQTTRRDLAIGRQLHVVPRIVVERSAILNSMRARVSISRVCAILGNHRPGGLEFTEIHLEAEAILLKGVILEPSGVGGLAAFGTLDDLLRAVPGLIRGSGVVDSFKADDRGLPFEYRIELGDQA